MEILDGIRDAVVAGDALETKELCQRAIEEGCSASQILEEGLIAGMNVIGPRFKNNEVFVPEVLIAARAMHSGMDVIKTLIVSSDVKEKGTIVIGTVKGDLHDIGKNLVVIMLEGSGYKVIDLGVDLAAEKFVEAVEQYQPQIVGLSALLTTTMGQMKNTVDTLRTLKLKPKIMVGGAPVSQEFCDQIGADAYAADAASAVEIANALIASD
ncbi:corrinoid protein [Desulfosporosinus youngiae]|uniref:Putative cobalamin binding protein n=1 Tax=Desulfosporosinus youngiae DSM 17734 TaxID=768710 RepID=H5Y0F2_9FIRM|nr:corrinoid protein [Desulfosporosinus youngiae]EHQ92208.1 putative cobalamin binding protein [Desulfosporosinus youngiae DSM 17734]